MNIVVAKTKSGWKILGELYDRRRWPWNWGMDYEAADTTPRPKHHLRRRRSVAWLSLRELARSGAQAAKATEYAAFADSRAVQAARPLETYDATSHGRCSFTFDYLADTGDGYNATFAVAMSMFGGAAETGGPQKNESSLLVLGGDEVYPYASVEHYDDRLGLPFKDARAAAGNPESPRFVVATPGNHDWYDGLVGFLRNFAESYIDRRSAIDPRGPAAVVQLEAEPPKGWIDEMLGCKTFQSRSYYAIHLPHGWWLWGVDIQLDSYLDAEQLAYFTLAQRRLKTGERVILCTARPSWIDDPRNEHRHRTTNRETLTWFVNRFFGNEDNRWQQDQIVRVPLMLSGDKHHYVHYRKTDAASASATEKGSDPKLTAPEHLVTCGGGGAYLSSTHRLEAHLRVPWHLEEKSTTCYDRGETWPTRSASRWLRLLAFRVPFVNGIPMPLVVGLVGVLLTEAWLRSPITQPVDLSCPNSLCSATQNGLNHWPFWLALVLTAAVLVPIGAVLGAKDKGNLIKLLPGSVHTAAQLAVGYGMATWFKHSGREHAVSWDLDMIGYTLAAGGAALAVFTVYWPICDLFGFHENESFSSMRLSSFKSHLRVTIEAPTKGASSGNLTITPYFIRRVPWNLQRRQFNWWSRWLLAVPRNVSKPPRVEAGDPITIDAV